MLYDITKGDKYCPKYQVEGDVVENINALLDWATTGSATDKVESFRKKVEKYDASKPLYLLFTEMTNKIQ